MANIFIISDPHFGHANILSFVVHSVECRNKYVVGSVPIPCDCPKMRPGFQSYSEMDEHMIAEWNAVVKSKDKVYVLGDIAMGKEHIKTIGACHGHKRLVRGNHDTYPTKEYLPYFEEIYGVRVFDDMIFSHIPLHIESLKPQWTNVHGHVHNNQPPLHLGPKYLNVSCEVLNYRPQSFEEVRQRIADQKAENQRLIDANLKRLGVTKRWTDEELRS